ncbi:endonuclease MutS2 [Chitinophagales bacterium]|nr:endonuclease MutS2 [Chitinophagales bacterium]
MELTKTKRVRTSMIYPNDALAKLEYDKVVELLRGPCRSPQGLELASNLPFMCNVGRIELALKQAHEFLLILGDDQYRFPAHHYYDLSKELKSLEIERSVLGPEQVFRMLGVLQLMQELHDFFEVDDGERIELFSALYSLVEKIKVDKSLLNAIKEVLDEDGKVRSSASPDLASIRKSLSRKYREMDSRFRSLVGEYRKNGWLEESGETIRNGRRVLSVRAENKRKIKGIIVDESSTGKTTFIEPEETLHINNEIFDLQQQEKREIWKIMMRLTNELRVHRPELIQYQSLIGQLDLIRAKAVLAKSMKATMPKISKIRMLELVEARHPLLYLINKEQNKKTVPQNLRLSMAERLLIISGPNAGGKSVALKTVGLLQLMVQTGLLVPVNELSVFGVFHNIFIDMGDEQSLENDLSTYSSRLLNMRYFSKFANNKTMILIDEFGSGTDPKFGGAIAESVLEDLHAKSVYGLITTHYSNLKIYATETKGILNGNMAFDQEELLPMYRLDVGKAGSSYAFELAERCGVESSILERAKTKISDDYREFDELLTSMQSEKVELEKRKAKLSVLEKSLDRKSKLFTEEQDSFSKKRKKLLLKTEEKAVAELEATKKRLSELLKDFQQEKNKDKLAAKIRTEIEQEKKKRTDAIEEHKDVIFEGASSGELVVGASVRWREGSQVGTVLEIKGKDTVVQFNTLRSRVKTKELIVVPKKSVLKRKNIRIDTLDQPNVFSANLDVRGKSKDETLAELEQWLDSAVMQGAELIKVVHGRGTGILRQSVRRYLRNRKEVKSVADEEQQYGGNGVTMIELH